MKPLTHRVKILCLFDYKATTGFATVSRNIIREIRREFGPLLEIHIIPINYFSEKVVLQDDDDRHTFIFPMTKAQCEKDEFGRFDFLRRLNNRPDVAMERYKDELVLFPELKPLNELPYNGYFVMADAGIGVGMLPHLQQIAGYYEERGWKKARGLFYFPVDSIPLDTFFPTEGPGLGFFDHLVTYTNYGRKEILKKAPHLRDKLSVIPHGNNGKDFYPFPEEERKAFRDLYFGSNSDKLIIININRNQWRKDIPTSMLGVWQFRQDHPELKGKVFLYLHMHPVDYMGWDLRLIGLQLGWVEGIDYGFPPEGQQHHAASIETMRGIYNAADLYLTTTSGEGWGLSITEAMQCECPVIAPLHTSLIEIGGLTNQGCLRMWPLECDAPYCGVQDSVFRWQVSSFEVSERIAELLDHPEEKARKIMQARDYMRGMSWRKVCEDWAALFSKLFF